MSVVIIDVHTETRLRLRSDQHTVLVGRLGIIVVAETQRRMHRIGQLRLRECQPRGRRLVAAAVPVFKRAEGGDRHRGQRQRAQIGRIVGVGHRQRNRRDYRDTRMGVVFRYRHRGAADSHLRVDVLDVDIELGPACQIGGGTGRRVDADDAAGAVADREVSSVGGVGSEFADRRCIADAGDIGL